MCGILCIIGPDSENEVRRLIPRIEHRGPDEIRVKSIQDITLGFTRLAINGSLDIGSQPFEFDTLIGTFNGEIYNHRELIKTYDLPSTDCDTHVILPLFQEIGNDVLQKLDGFYSGVFVNIETGKVWCMRSHMGKKPLFYGRNGQYFFITSELKAIEQIDCFEPVPLGLSTFDPSTGLMRCIAEHAPVNFDAEFTELFRDAVIKRLPQEGQPIGVFLSGGLDSSLVAAIVSEHRADATYFTLGNQSDLQNVEAVIQALDLQDVREVSLPLSEDFPDLIRDLVFTTESYNPSIISNGLGSFLLSKAAHEANIKVVLGGEGADELFGGYHTFADSYSVTSNGDDWKQVRYQLISDMRQTELRRLDLTSMAHSVEVRCPFLDRRLRSFSDTLTFEDMYEYPDNKILLRISFPNLLPKQILWRKKTSLDVGSGIRKLVTEHLKSYGVSERATLRNIWCDIFKNRDPEDPYYSIYPAFDDVIDVRGDGHR